MPDGRQDVKFTEPDAALNNLTEAVIGAAIEVHRVLGPGFLESVYENALCVELRLRGIPFVRQAVFPVIYKDARVGEHRIDLIVDQLLVVEPKAAESLTPIFTAQSISNLKTSARKLCLLINFNVRVRKDGIKRVVLT
ncbi:MAG TPA: GxxExxY protein [Humisphaera sp.]|nr:GxxExxY protein [Humisphaera sp.]